MPDTIRVSDGSKAATFDGFTLEVSGLSGSSRSQRLAIEAIVSVSVAQAGDEVMFGVRSRKGGFGLVVSADRRREWESLAAAVSVAVASLPR